MAADRLRDRDNAAGIGDNSAEIGDNSAEIGDNSAETGDNSAEIGDNSAETGDNSAEIGDNSAELAMAPQGSSISPRMWSHAKLPSWMETGVTLFLEEQFQRGLRTQILKHA